MASLDTLHAKNDIHQNSKIYINNVEATDNTAIESSRFIPLIPFILEKFMFKKTANLSPEQLNTKLDALIGSSSARSHRHSLSVSCAVPEFQIPDTVSLLADFFEGIGR